MSRASIVLFAFSTDPLATDIELSAARFGVPSRDAIAGADVQTHARDEDPQWFDELRTGGLRAIADGDLPDAGRLDTARYCHSIQVDLDDPPDLGHLQAAWAVAGWLVSRGCFAVLDAHACRWLDQATVTALVPRRPFGLDAEVRFMFENQPTPGFGHAMHTRGMVKFARPDLICGVTPNEARLLERVLRRLAQMSADGAVVTVGQRMRADEQHIFRTVAYEPDVNAPQVNLNNEALLIVAA